MVINIVGHFARKISQLCVFFDCKRVFTLAKRAIIRDIYHAVAPVITPQKFVMNGATYFALILCRLLFSCFVVHF